MLSWAFFVVQPMTVSERMEGKRTTCTGEGAVLEGSKRCSQSDGSRRNCLMDPERIYQNGDEILLAGGGAGRRLNVHWECLDIVLARWWENLGDLSLAGWMSAVSGDTGWMVVSLVELPVSGDTGWMVDCLRYLRSLDSLLRSLGCRELLAGAYLDGSGLGRTIRNPGGGELTGSAEGGAP
ncbi:hypothetical protein F0562_024084 [Nyssa sinensis]|uniref:Uncharacterized protein n=1 Tax=Nyssa sinensis TaxID=561372 RepID=A0A5J5BMI1_9ASTE|nr:hypothetical protein F0562_024084 [Nyssa sinensis]